ncbi:MAG: PAS domain S-box protein [Magnetococcales bacterium]|nr:PAS domain S-box protein [Magnetococcales bacterium]
MAKKVQDQSKRDKSDRREVKKALRVSEARYKAVVEDQTDLVCRYRPDGVLAFVNSAFCHHYRQPDAALLGRSFFSLLPGEDGLKLRKSLNRLTPESPVLTRESQGFLPGGERCWQQWSDRAIFTSKGRLLEYQSVGRDITELKRVEGALRQANEEMENRVMERTREVLSANRELSREIEERRRAEEALLGSQEKLRALLDHSPYVILTIDPKGGLLFMNRSLEELTEWGIFDARTKALFPGRLRGCFQRGFSRVFEEGGEDRFHYSTGRAAWWEVRMVPIHGQGDEVTAAMVIAADETEKRVLWAQSVRHARLATIGVLAAGVAHEINNPNNAILFNAGLFVKAWADIEPILKEFQEENGAISIAGFNFEEAMTTFPQLLSGVGDNARRIKNIVGNLKHMAKQDAGELNQEVDLHEAVRAAAMILQNRIRKHTDHWTVRFMDGHPKIRGNSQQLEQVFINIMLNALQSLPDRSSRVTVSTVREGGREGEEAGGSVLVIVEDEGHGIDSEHLPHLTEPFYTTRTETGGTGLGLSISNAIIQKHRGEIYFESQPGEGSRVTVRLPVGDPV